MTTTDARRAARTAIGTKIVTALAKEFGAIQTGGLQIDFGAHVDTWLSLPPDFSKSKLSDDRIVATLEKEFGVKFAKGAFVRFSDDQPVSDIWLTIPSGFLKGELPDAEIQAVTGKSMMIHYDVTPGKPLQTANSGELLCIGFGIYPAKFF